MADYSPPEDESPLKYLTFLPEGEGPKRQAVYDGPGAHFSLVNTGEFPPRLSLLFTDGTLPLADREILLNDPPISLGAVAGALVALASDGEVPMTSRELLEKIADKRYRIIDLPEILED